MRIDSTAWARHGPWLMMGGIGVAASSAFGLYFLGMFGGGWRILVAVAVVAVVATVLGFAPLRAGVGLLFGPGRWWRRTLGFVVAATGLLIWALVTSVGQPVGVLIAASAEMYDGPSKFTPEAWREHEDARWHMADRLVDCETLHGLTRAEVRDLLGDPVSSPHHGAAGRGDFVYYLGPERNPIFGIDSEWLNVVFGPDDRVRTTFIDTD